MRSKIFTLALTGSSAASALPGGAQHRPAGRAPLGSARRVLGAAGGLAVTGAAMAQTAGVLGPMEDALDEFATGNILNGIGVVIGICVTVALGFMVLRTVRGG